jgi:hypothetical protein
LVGPLLGILAVLAFAGAGAAAEAGGAVGISAGPVLPPGAPASSYFELTAAPGTVLHEAVRIANPRDVGQVVQVLPAFGKTARNSGDTYPAPVLMGEPCEQTSCWIGGLPTQVRLAPHAEAVVPFSVSVPSGTPPGEYLAGVVARPVGPEPTSLPRPRAGVGVGAAVAPAVAIGVAIVVPGPLSPLLVIPTVTASLANGYLPMVNLVERNLGNTWLHPSGDVTVRVGAHEVRAAVRSGTVLPGDQATLPVIVLGVTGGLHPVRAELWYWHHTRLAVWQGELDFPTPPQVLHLHGETILVQPGLPAWAIGLIAGLGGLLGVLAGLWLFVFWRRRQKKDEEAEQPRGDQAEDLVVLGGRRHGR